MGPSRIAATFSIIGACLLFSTCSALPNRNPAGQIFPKVDGESLTGKNVSLPGDLPKEKLLLLVGYRHKTQFDIDRWMLGLGMAKLTVPIYELPTLPGMAAKLFSGRIDNSMRAGIPRPDWSAVITIYGDDAETIARMTGTERPKNARAILLDTNRKIIWFHDQGYSPRVLLELKAFLERGK